MRNIFLIVAIITTLMACKKNDVERECIETQLCLIILDKDSTDMLNPDNPNGYKFCEMGLYKDLELKDRLTNGWYLGSEECCVSNIKFEKKIYYFIRFIAPMDSMEKRDGKVVWCATSYLKLNETTIDTVYTEVVETEYSQILKKVLYNGVDISRTRLVIKK
ncbi:MAG: hypothetical protein J6W13_01460 [Salinivirgaceae bacterium]|nr:hypothetical protein [Salinivirgaceae bacterium]MBR2194636.1 hypothetical protein [Salinivirgaceae bacterium]